MSMKALFLSLCVALALLAGCGRSKPESSKSTAVDALAADDAANSTPPDASQQASSPQAQSNLTPAATASPQDSATPHIPAKDEASFGPGPNQDANQSTMTEAEREAYWLELKKNRESKAKAEQAQNGAAKSQSN
ncbi:MAG: hypothetical protein IJH04_08170 [Eggerthellaceae bacterium]|nr:hypothetical protein [Eggerthellaceae bacterium]